MRRMGCIVVILIVVGLTFVVWLRVKTRRDLARSARAPSAVPVDVQRVKLADLVPSVEVSGTITTDDRVAI